MSTARRAPQSKSAAKPVRPAKTSSAARRPDARAVLARLARLGSKSVRAGYARYGLDPDDAYGIPMGAIQALGKELGRDHELALELWKSGNYEARLLCAYLADPARVTPVLMDRWCRDFDNWGLVDTVCFVLFDRTPHTFAKIAAWAKREPEFEKRAAFALLASVALHDKRAPDAPFRRSLPLLERAATDERNFVKKGVLWALRLVGTRGPALHSEAKALAQRLAISTSPSARWIGRDALRYFASGPARKRVGRKRERQ